MSRASAAIGAALAFVAGALTMYLVTRPSGSTDSQERVAEVELSPEAVGAAAKEAGDVTRIRVPVTGKEPWKGSKDALVTIVEFSDFQCPFCNRVNGTLKQILDTYKGKVKIVWKNNPLPFHQNAMPAHMAAMEVHAQKGNEAFWQYHDKLFANQRQLTRENLEKWAQELGVDMTKFRQALDQQTHKAAIQADLALGRKVGARGTPNFFINGRQLVGAQPFDNFKKIIDDEIARAEKMVAAGVPRGQIYGALMKNAKAEAAQPQQRQQQQRRRPDPNAVYKVPVDADDPVKGPADALVTIVEFSDFQCPFCARVEGTLKQIVDTYGNKVRIVWKDNPLPFHQNAMPAAIAAYEVRRQKGDEAFWKYHDKLFANQRQLTRENLEKWAQELGVNMAKFRQALDQQTHKQAILKDQNLARSLGATGTPSFFINGRNLRGAQPFESFKRLIDEELAKAEKMVANGTPRARLYETIIAKGATSPKFIGGDAPGGNRPPAAAQKYEIAVPADAPRKGARNAKVIIQEFSDFQCPFCNRVLPTVQQILQEYGDKVQIVWRNYPLPFHQNARPAAIAAWEVYKQKGNDAFWKYHDLLFQNQRSLDTETLVRLAQQVGANGAQVRRAIEEKRHDAIVQRDMDAVRKAGARIGTPSFFINGRLVQGAQPFEAFKAAIEQALKEAR